MEIVVNVGEQFPQLTGPASDEFAKELLRLEDSDFEVVVLNMSGVESISSMAMGSIFASHQKLNEQGRRLIIKDASAQVSRLLKMVNMAHLSEEE